MIQVKQPLSVARILGAKLLYKWSCSLVCQSASIETAGKFRMNFREASLAIVFRRVNPGVGAHTVLLDFTATHTTSYVHETSILPPRTPGVFDDPVISPLLVCSKTNNVDGVIDPEGRVHLCAAFWANKVFISEIFKHTGPDASLHWSIFVDKCSHLILSSVFAFFSWYLRLVHESWLWKELPQIQMAWGKWSSIMVACGIVRVVLQSFKANLKESRHLVLLTVMGVTTNDLLGGKVGKRVTAPNCPLTFWSRNTRVSAAISMSTLRLWNCHVSQFSPIDSDQQGMIYKRFWKRRVRI